MLLSSAVFRLKLGDVCALSWSRSNKKGVHTKYLLVFIDKNVGMCSKIEKCVLHIPILYLPHLSEFTNLNLGILCIMLVLSHI